MNHDEAYGRLDDLASLHAAIDREAGVREHVADCRICQERLDRLTRARSALGALRGASTEEPSGGLAEAVLAIPVDHPRGTRRRRSSWMRAGIATSAAGAVVAALLLWPGTADDATWQRIAIVANRAPITGSLDVGDRNGATRPGLITLRRVPAGSRPIEVWLSGPGGATRVASMLPTGDGTCIQSVSLPSAARWNQVIVTREGQAPVAATALALSS